MDILVNPPTLDNSSQQTVDLYNKETSSNFNALKEKADIIYKKLNSMKNFSCNKIEGAMYAFPSINFSDNIIKKAAEMKMEPDLLYSLELLEETGIVTVPGSGFGQKKGTHHIRLTNLISPKEELVRQLDNIEAFTNKFFDKY